MKKVYLVDGYYTDIQRSVTLRVYAHRKDARKYAKWLMKHKSDFKHLTGVTIWEEILW